MPLEIVVGSVDKVAGSSHTEPYDSSSGKGGVKLDGNKIRYEFFDIPEIKLYKVAPTLHRSAMEVDKPFEMQTAIEHDRVVRKEIAADKLKTDKSGLHSYAPKSLVPVQQNLQRRKRTLVGAELDKHLLAASSTGDNDEQSDMPALGRGNKSVLQKSSLVEHLDELDAQATAALHLSARRTHMNTSAFQQQFEQPRHQMLGKSSALARRSAMQPGVLAPHLTPRSERACVDWVLEDVKFYERNLERGLFRLETELRDEVHALEEEEKTRTAGGGAVGDRKGGRTGGDAGKAVHHTAQDLKELKDDNDFEYGARYLTYIYAVFYFLWCISGIIMSTHPFI